MTLLMRQGSRTPSSSGQLTRNSYWWACRRCCLWRSRWGYRTWDTVKWRNSNVSLLVINNSQFICRIYSLHLQHRKKSNALCDGAVDGCCCCSCCIRVVVVWTCRGMKCYVSWRLRRGFPNTGRRWTCPYVMWWNSWVQLYSKLTTSLLTRQHVTLSTFHCQFRLCSFVISGAETPQC